MQHQPIEAEAVWKAADVREGDHVVDTREAEEVSARPTRTLAQFALTRECLVGPSGRQGAPSTGRRARARKAESEDTRRGEADGYASPRTGAS